MDKYQKLEQITNGINAAYKIKSAQKSLNRQDPEARQNINNLDLISQMLGIIAQYSPEPHRNTLNDKLEKTSLYGDAYKNLKQHIKALQTNKQVNREGFIKTLEIVRPVVNGEKRSIIEKILKIHQILNS